MAMQRHTTHLVNPKRGRRKKSLKQKLHFGTRAERAAARRLLSRKRKRNSAKSRRKSRRNPGHLYSLGKLAAAANPASRKRKKRRVSKPMAQKKHRKRRRRSNPAARPRRRRRTNPPAVRRRRRRANPVVHHRRRRRPRVNRARRHHMRNPRMGGRIGSFIVQAGWTVAGAVGTRAATQLALGSKNDGPMGYVANAAAALILGTVVGKFFNKAAGTAVTVGGFVGIVLRGVQEFTNIGKVVNLQLQGMGDYPFAGMRGLRSYEPFDFFSPLASADARGTVTGAATPPAMIARVAESVMPHIPAGGGGMSGLRAGRSRYAGARVWG
jgi:hypothetical protein